MRNIGQDNDAKQISRNRWGIKDTRQKPLAFRWWEPDCTPVADDDPDSGAVSTGCTGDEPGLENGWAQPDPPLEKFAFRKHADGSLEFKGHLDAAGASSGSIAFHLPGVNAGEVNFLPSNDQFFHTTITDDSGLTFTLALVRINKTTGAVTITWPAVG